VSDIKDGLEQVLKDENGEGDNGPADDGKDVPWEQRVKDTGDRLAALKKAKEAQGIKGPAPLTLADLGML